MKKTLMLLSTVFFVSVAFSQTWIAPADTSFGSDFGRKDFYYYLTNTDKELFLGGLKKLGIDTLNCNVVELGSVGYHDITKAPHTTYFIESINGNVVEGLKCGKGIYTKKTTLCITYWKSNDRVQFYFYFKD
jgi:hypothetical protein